MRIDRLEVRNFKKFAELTLDLHPQFTLLVGENGSGKTTILDALAVALGVWLVKPPDSVLLESRRWITGYEIRLEPVQYGDRIAFQEMPPTVVTASGRIADQDVVWSRRRTLKMDNGGARQAIQIIQQAFGRAKRNEPVLLPVIAYYPAGRAWLPHGTGNLNSATGPARRWAAFENCLARQMRNDPRGWFQGEAIAAVNRGGQYRPGFEVVRRAVRGCVHGADGMWYDGDYKDIILSIDGRAQPFGNLSDGQRMMMGLVADIAIRAVVQNNFLVPPDTLTAEDEPLPRVLAQTPGVVLIDELDVHLHPRWQRRVAADLKRTFPAIQFVCASHSPQVIGEVAPEEIRLLDEPHPGLRPAVSVGLDSNAVLEEVMGADSRSEQSRLAIDGVEEALEKGDLDLARQRLQELRRLQHGNTRDTSRLEATINSLEALANAAD